jgi:hypothetical protein
MSTPVLVRPEPRAVVYMDMGTSPGVGDETPIPATKGAQGATVAGRDEIHCPAGFVVAAGNSAPSCTDWWPSCLGGNDPMWAD